MIIVKYYVNHVRVVGWLYYFIRYLAWEVFTCRPIAEMVDYKDGKPIKRVLDV